MKAAAAELKHFLLCLASAEECGQHDTSVYERIIYKSQDANS